MTRCLQVQLLLALPCAAFAYFFEAAGDQGSAFVQVKASASQIHKSGKRGIKQPKLRYVPHKYLKSCPTVGPDFGPHPNIGAVKGLGQHLQVAMEVSCTNFFMRCAYATKDFNLLADAISGGLLMDDLHKKDRELLTQGIAAGAEKVHEHGINNSLERQQDEVKCNTLPVREEQIKFLTEAIQTHFHAYKASPAALRNSRSFADGIALAFCDQIGDTGDSPCNDLMSAAVGKALK